MTSSKLQRQFEEEAQIKFLIGERDKYTRELAKVVDEVENKKKEYAEVEQKMFQVVDRRVKLQEDVETTENMLIKLSKDVDSLKHTIISLNAEKDILEHSNGVKKKILSTLEQSIENTVNFYKNEKKFHEDEVSREKGILTQTKKDLQTKKQEIASLQAMTVFMNAQLDRRAEALKEQEIIMEKRELDCKRKEKAVSTLERRLHVIVDKLDMRELLTVKV